MRPPFLSAGHPAREGLAWDRQHTVSAPAGCRRDPFRGIPVRFAGIMSAFFRFRRLESLRGGRCGQRVRSWPVRRRGGIFAARVFRQASGRTGGTGVLVVRLSCPRCGSHPYAARYRAFVLVPADRDRHGPAADAGAAAVALRVRCRPRHCLLPVRGGLVRRAAGFGQRDAGDDAGLVAAEALRARAGARKNP
jgi:hypothetical protein